MAFVQGLEARARVGADLGGARDQVLVADHVEHRETRRGGDGVPAERAEELRLMREPVDVGAAGDHGRDGVSVAHRLAERDHVGLQAARHERPQVLAGAPVSGLHLVGDHPRPDLAGGRADLGVVVRARRQDAVARVRRVQDQGRRPVPSRRELLDRLADRGRGGSVLDRRAEWLHVVGTPVSSPLLWGERRRGRGHAVVGVGGHESAVVARRHRREPPGQVGGLAAGVDEQHGVEPRSFRHRGHEPFRELDRLRVQVAQVRVQQPRLVGDRIRDARVRVPDDRHVVVRVEVAPPVDVLEPDAVAALEVQRGRVRERRQRGAEHVGAPRDQGGGRRCRLGRPEPPGGLARAELVELLEHAPGVAVPALDVAGILGEPLARARPRSSQ